MSLRVARRCGGPADPTVRLICLPFAGGGASLYADWARLPPEPAADVWAVQLAGRETRRAEPPATRLEPVVEELTAGLRPLLDRPFALFGYSMGALLAFELSRRLRRAGGPLPEHLFLAAHRAPDLPPTREAVSTLPADRFLSRLRSMAWPDPLPTDDPELLLLLGPMLRADFELCETYRYRPEPELDLTATLFCAVDDPEVDVGEVAAWSRLVTRPGPLHVYRGGHLFLRRHADDILRRVADGLSTAPAR